MKGLVLYANKLFKYERLCFCWRFLCHRYRHFQRRLQKAHLEGILCHCGALFLGSVNWLNKFETNRKTELLNEDKNFVCQVKVNIRPFLFQRFVFQKEIRWIPCVKILPVMLLYTRCSGWMPNRLRVRSRVDHRSRSPTTVVKGNASELNFSLACICIVFPTLIFVQRYFSSCPLSSKILQPENQEKV